jgi:hypothetical protein
MANVANAKIFYREKLFPSANTALALAMPIPIFWLAGFPFHPVLGLLIGILVSVAAYSLVWLRSPSIIVTENGLNVAGVELPLSEIASVEIFLGAAAQVERGPRRDQRAFVVLRGTASKLVKFTLNSAIDPTPYWLVGTRQPSRLSAAVQRLIG